MGTGNFCIHGCYPGKKKKRMESGIAAHIMMSSAAQMSKGKTNKKNEQKKRNPTLLEPAALAPKCG